ncbi:hypothetical protein BN938_0744 [Mucinivorans hirudinis]|uniref:Uncharacterized protein n=1 Tax=Mucinivorans hirudinis TaxID=1433126 RepID=A0A060RBW8_9BACT|nr:hypothetical protein BN938_0744 [Mucinivorans hirudinis]
MVVASEGFHYQYIIKSHYERRRGIFSKIDISKKIPRPRSQVAN